MLYADKYRPKSLSEFTLHSDIAGNLEKLIAHNDCPHTLFYGPTGAGKKTLILALLREIYGAGVEKLKIESKPWKIELPTRTLEIEFTTISSAHHVELNPSDVGNNDRYVVQEIIHEMARNRPVGIHGARTFKMLILNEVDRMSKDAQHSLRRTMEKYTGACRIVLCCTNVSKVIEPVRSRCLCVRVRAPTHEEIEGQLQAVAGAEGWAALPPTLCARLATSSGRNLRRALLSLEACKAQQFPFRDDQPVDAPDWEQYIAEIARDIQQEQSPKQLYLVRGKLYELLVNCIPPETLLRQLASVLMQRLDDELRHSVAQHAAFFEHRLQQGSKAIFHIEAFVARFMADYKHFLITALE